MNKKTIRDLSDGDLRGKRALVRVDFNVPIENGRVGDDTRIRAALPTIQGLLDRGARVILLSHLGRPKGKPEPKYSLEPVARRLGELMPKEHVVFVESTDTDEAIKETHEPSARVVLLENTRFLGGEEKNEERLSRGLAELGDLYVNDAFGSAHRAHASTEGIVHHVKQAAAGLLMEAEVQHLGKILENPDRPFVAVLGGAKVSDKLEVIQNLVPRVDALLIGGAMAYTFFKARGLAVGTSLVEDDLLDAARDVEKQARARNLRFELPVDHVVAPKLEAGAPAETLDVGDPAIGARMGLDIGPKTVATYRRIIAGARTVTWNGPMGVFEIEAFATGTVEIARAIAEVKGTTVIGGGDSIAAVAKAGVTDRITHISTGGGASLEFLGGRKLPGVVALG
jgi:phosphoglycerate kinase